MTGPTVAVFRPADERLTDAVEYLESRGASAVADPMLAVEPTGETPREDGAYTIFTSKTGVELVAESGWESDETSVCAIGPSTAGSLGEHGYAVDCVPTEYTSSGLVDALADDVDGARVEVARSDHGSPTLLDGLEAAGAYLHETTLYRLVRPPESGGSAERAARGEIDAACFTSSLTIEHFLEAADERGVLADVRGALDNAIIGVIGPPTAETAETNGFAVDVVAEEATAKVLFDAVLSACETNHLGN